MKIIFLLFLLSFTILNSESIQEYRDNNVRKIDELGTKIGNKLLSAFTNLPKEEIDKLTSDIYVTSYFGDYNWVVCNKYIVVRIACSYKKMYFRGFYFEKEFFNILKKFPKYDNIDFLKIISEEFFERRLKYKDLILEQKFKIRNVVNYNYKYYSNKKNIEELPYLGLELTEANQLVGIYVDVMINILTKKIKITKDKAEKILNDKFLKIIDKLSDKYFFDTSTLKTEYNLVYSEPTTKLMKTEFEENKIEKKQSVIEERTAVLSHQIIFMIKGNFRGGGKNQRYYDNFLNIMEQESDKYPYVKDGIKSAVKYKYGFIPEIVYNECEYKFFLRCDVETGEFLGGSYGNMGKLIPKDHSWIDKIVLYFLK